jgi:hypothetical protein
MRSLSKQETTFKASFKVSFKAAFKAAVIDDSVTTTAEVRLSTLAAVLAKQTAAAHEIPFSTSALRVPFYTVS